MYFHVFHFGGPAATHFPPHKNPYLAENPLNSFCKSLNGAMATAERILAPAAVLGLHVLLLANVAAHRRHLHTWPLVGRAWLEWIIALLALGAYLRTVCCDPGVLVEVSDAVERPRRGKAWWLCCLCCCFRAKAREMRAATDLELQPIGRAQLDAMAEEVEDPGEEIISLEDLGGESMTPKKAHVEHEESAPSAPRRRHPWQEQRMQSGAKLRFCKVCQMHQPLRTKHCRDCEKCIRTHDHHCPWVGTCVGEGNRVYFYWFLVLQWLELAIFLAESVLTFKADGLIPSLWLAQAPLLLMGIGVKSLIFIMVTCLVGFHSYLALANVTTWENMSWHHISYLKGLDPDVGSPFSRSWRSNLALYCCSHLSELGKRTEDGWMVWELGEQHDPLDNVCCNMCKSFDVEE